MTKPIYIVATGARTPLGLTAAPMAAAVRAGITALVEHPFMVDQVGNLMPAALDPELDPQIVGAERLIKMAECALREAGSALNGTSASRSSFPIFLGLPEFRPGFSDADAKAVQVGLKRTQGLSFQISQVNALPQGHSAGIAALEAAATAMWRGDCEACFVGGVESYFHPDTMEWLDANRQLVGEISRSAFVPGEGAAFCLLMTEKGCAQSGLKPFARIQDVSIGIEMKIIKTTEACFGEGLSETVHKTVSRLQSPGTRINQIFCDINGERYRGEEWGFVCLRMSEYFDDPNAYHSPAECLGDIGAASVPLFIVLSCQEISRQYSKGLRTLLWASSEGGQRGAAVLEILTQAAR